jgi:hypothetical protein
MESKLQGAKSLNDIINIVNQYYDLDEPLGVIAKPMAIASVKKAVTTLKLKQRK